MICLLTQRVFRMDAEEGMFFVELEQPVDIRRDILETLKEIITTLKKFERFKEIRAERIKAINEYRYIMGEIYELNNQLRAKIPKAKINLKKKTISKPVAVTVSHKKKTVVKRSKRASELDKLENELASIEAKLGKL